MGSKSTLYHVPCNTHTKFTCNTNVSVYSAGLILVRNQLYIYPCLTHCWRNSNLNELWHSPIKKFFEFSPSLSLEKYMHLILTLKELQESAWEMLRLCWEEFPGRPCVENTWEMSLTVEGCGHECWEEMCLGSGLFHVTTAVGALWLWCLLVFLDGVMTHVPVRDATVTWWRNLRSAS